MRKLMRKASEIAEKGSNTEPWMVPKINKNPQKRRPRKRFEKIEKIMKKIFRKASAFGRTNRGRNIIRATQPANRLSEWSL